MDDFPTPGGPIYLHTKYQNFAQSPFKLTDCKYIDRSCNMDWSFFEFVSPQNKSKKVDFF